ncbi:hypothetical protein LTS08_006184 [Lithohypha guttulata]|nr:hypothetical protein LTS08_006184 [Lithohypha guttulata]
MNATRYEHRDGMMNDNTGAGSQFNNNGAGNQVNWPGPDGTATFNFGSSANHSSSYGNVVVSGQAHLGNQYNFYNHANPATRVPAASIVVNPKEQVMALLRNDETFSRYAQVEKSFGNSFSWLFENEGLGFSKWLKDDTSLYWIRGKPASGKSTLMKMAYSHPRTQAILKNSDCRRAGAAFFFHDRGSLYQKSFVGLLCSILYQVLSALPELIEHVLPAFGSTLTTPTTRRLHQDITFSLAELQAAFELVSMQTVYSVHVLLFLDALDEYSGKYEDIAKFLVSTVRTANSLTASTRIKICFSSRPLNIFLDYFPEVPGFSMQDHTRADMEIVVDTILRGNRRMEQRLDSEDGLVNGPVSLLRQQILERADGVFLWVRLVLDELLEAFCDGADVAQLNTLLECIPNDLNEFYLRILDRIPQMYKEDALIMLDIVRCVLQPLNAEAFYDTFRNAQSEKLATFEFGNMSVGLLDRLERLLRSRTGGLLELVSNLNSREIESLKDDIGRGVDVYRVQFIHQTVKTFVQQSDTRLRLNERASSTTGFEYSLKAHFAAAERVYRISGKKMETQLKQILGYELECGQLPIEFSIDLLKYLTYTGTTTVDQLTAILRLATDEAVVAAYHTRLWREEWGFPATSTVTELAAVAGLHLYIREHFTNRPLPASEADRLLCLATESFILMSDSSLAEVSCYPSVVDTILQAMTRDTPGIRLEAYQKFWIVNFVTRDPVVACASYEAVELFLQHGQDVNMLMEYKIEGTKGIVKNTALHMAVWHCNMEQVTLLLRYGALVNTLNTFEQTPVDGAYEKFMRVRDSNDFQTTIRIIARLLDAGGKVTSKRGKISVAVHLKRVGQAFQQYRELRDATGEHLIERILHPPILVVGTSFSGVHRTMAWIKDKTFKRSEGATK